MTARDTFNGLTPPIGTSFFKQDELVLLSDQTFPSFSDAVVSWSVSMYKYAVNAVPTDPNFQAKNGRVYIIMLHRGSFSRAKNWTSQSLSVRLDNNENTVIPDGMYPGPNAGVAQDDGTRKYAINFTHLMQMFRNQGNEAFTFEAKYQHDYVLKVEQNAFPFTREHSWGFSKEANNDVGLVAINGLTVYQCLDPTKEVRFTFGHNGFSNQTQLSEFYKTITVNVGQF